MGELIPKRIPLVIGSEDAEVGDLIGMVRSQAVLSRKLSQVKGGLSKSAEPQTFRFIVKWPREAASKCGVTLRRSENQPSRSQLASNKFVAQVLKHGENRMATNYNIPKVVKDKQGSPYRVRVNKLGGGNLLVTLWGAIGKIGELNLTLSFPVLRIEGLWIFDGRYGITAIESSSWFERVFSNRSKMVSFRSKGLGSRLLAIAKEYATEHGYEAIEGRLALHQLEETKHLRDLYRKAGFEIHGKAGDEGIYYRVPR